MIHDPKAWMDQTLLDMRGRCLSLAADLDRVERLAGQTLAGDRLTRLRAALGVLLEQRPNRAERVQMIFTDVTPPPVYSKSHK